jgi:chitodextrinase
MKHILLFAIVLLGFSSTSFGQHYKAGNKKIIEFGWDIQNYDYVADNLATMEYAPFEGIAFDLKIPKLGTRRAWSLCNPNLVLESDFDFTKLNRIRSNKFTDNFIRVFAQDDFEQKKFSWFDDAVWSNISASTKVLGKAVVASQSKGIFLDTEKYFLPNPWAYHDTLYPNKSTTELYIKVRQRGREFMSALQSEAPSAKVLYMFGYGAATNWGSNTFYAQEYALLKPFLDGMLEAAGPQISLIDGNEAGYWSHQNDLYTWWYGQINVQYLLDRVPAEFQAKYKAQYSVASPFIVNQPFNIYYAQPEYNFNYGYSLSDQKRWAEHAVYNNLLTTDEYVWTWSQGDVDWWTKPTFPNKQNCIDAINGAKQKLAAGQSQGSIMVRDGAVRLQASLQTGGTTVTLSGPANNGTVPVGNVTFNLSLPDPTQINYYNLYFNSKPEFYLTSPSKVKNLAAGKYTVWAYGLTKDGMAFQTNPITFTVSNNPSDTQAPSAPLNVTSSGITTSSANLSWSASTDNVGVVSYDVFRDLGFIGNTTNTSFTLTGLNANTNYTITVKARDAAGNISIQSTPIGVKTLPASDTQAPTVPVGLYSAGITQSSANIYWSASTDNVGVTGHDVFRDQVFVGNTANTTYGFTGLTANTNYIFTVKARDAAGNVSSASAGLAVKTLAAADTQSPTAPSALTASGITQTGFVTNWTAATDNVGVASYDVFRDGIFVTNIGGTSYTFSGLQPNTNYSITVKARDAAGNVSSASAGLAVKTLVAADTQSPTAPSALTASGITQTGFVTNWNAATDNVGVASYDVFRDGIFVTNIGGTSYTFSGLQPNANYSITVKARDAAGNVSSASSAILVKTLAQSSGGPDCASITMTPGAGKITFSGLQAPVVMIQIFDNQWKTVFSCAGNCNQGTQEATGLAAVQHYAKVDFLDASWKSICVKEQFITVGGGGTATGILTLTAPSDITVQASANGQATVNYAIPEASSTCPTGQVTLLRKSGAVTGSSFAVGAYQICYTATDGCSNSKEVCFNITVQAPPVSNDPCGALTVSGTGGNIMVSNIGAEHAAMQLFTSNWNYVASCFGNCSLPAHTFAGIGAGNYILKVDLYGAGWKFLCQKTIQVTVTSGQNLQAKNALIAEQKGADISIQAYLGEANAVQEYNIERSKDGSGFEKIAQVSGQNYITYLDKLVTEGYYQYRLRAANNHQSGSGLVSDMIKIGAVESLMVYPNPAREVIQVSRLNAEKEALVEIFGVHSTKLITQTFPENVDVLSLEISHLPSGVYHVHLITEGYRAAVRKFMKID